MVNIALTRCNWLLIAWKTGMTLIFKSLTNQNKRNCKNVLNTALTSYNTAFYEIEEIGMNMHCLIVSIFKSTHSM